jgi:hypothetical protein
MNRHDFETTWNAALRSDDPSLADFDALAQGVIELVATDDQFRVHASNRLRQIDSQALADLSSGNVDLPIARRLIADELGFDNWSALTEATETMSEPLLFRYAVAAMVRGDFSALESAIGADAFCDRIVEWYEDGRFDEDPETLAEIFSAACMLGQHRAAAFLLDKGVDPYAGTRTGLAGFHYAASSGRLEVIKLLIERGVPMEVTNMYGGTVLGQALWSAVNEYKTDHAAIIEALIDGGAVIEPGTLEWWSEQKIADDETRRRVANAIRNRG